MKSRSLRAPRVDTTSKTILEDIRQKIESTALGLDATHYRAQHGNQLDLLDQLERRGFLRKDMDKYWVTFQGLVVINDHKTQELLRSCERVFDSLKVHYRSNPKTQILIADLAKQIGMPYGQVAICLGYMCEFHFWGAHTNSFENPSEAYVSPAETILRYRNFKEIVDQTILAKQQHETSLRKLKFLPSPLSREESEWSTQGSPAMSFDEDYAWKAIKGAYDTDKKAFGRKVRFISDAFKREIIFRDVAQAFLLAEAGFSKPAVILAGSVLEELLRLFLEFRKVKPDKDTFNSYIKACVDNKLLKSPVHQLTDSVRQFRNLVHLQAESSIKHAISKATAKGAVSSIFTIVNDLQ